MGARGHSVVARIACSLILAATMAAGCGTGSSAKRTIVFWQFSPIETIRPIVEKFQAENPGLSVRVEQLTWQSGREKIVAAIAAGKPPDLCELGSTFLPGLVSDSTLADLTDDVRDLKAELLGWDVATYKGRAYAIPWMLGTRALYLNGDLLRRAGLRPENPPATWSEFARAVAAVAALDPEVEGFGMNSGEREIMFKRFMPFAWGNGGSILDSTLTRSVVSSPANLEALRFYLSLKPNSLLDRQEMLEESFIRGRLGFIISGPWLLRKLPGAAPHLHFEVGLMPRPAASKGTPASFAGAEVLGIFRGSRDREGALRLARFLVREENAMPLYVATGNAFPAARAAAEDSFFIDHPRDRVFVEQLRTAVSPPLHPRWVEIEEILNAELEEAIYGKKTPEAALRSADERINAALKRAP